MAALTVPADHAGLFRKEARDTLEGAAGNLNEALRWHREGRGEPERIPYELAKVRRADRLCDQLSDPPAEYRVHADPSVLIETLQGCALTASEAIHEAAEVTLDRAGRAGVRLAVAELEMWLGMLEALEPEAS